MTLRFLCRNPGVVSTPIPAGDRVTAFGRPLLNLVMSAIMPPAIRDEKGRDWIICHHRLDKWSKFRKFLKWQRLMIDQNPTIPWSTPALWKVANAVLGQNVTRNRRRLTESFRLASRLRDHLLSIFPLMDGLCQRTCPACRDICCRHAWVWADFRDLLFLHLADIPAPGEQLLNQRGEHCRYASPQGCRLDRLQRPFVCTWYLCPAQTRMLHGQPTERARLAATLQQIKVDRRLMEDQFIRALFR
jgi:hypothetical protein